MGDVTKSPFAEALRHAAKLVVVVDEACSVPERAWCVFELEMAARWSIPTFMWPDELSNLYALQDKVQCLDVRKAKASDLDDLSRIQIAISLGTGADTMNERLRHFMGDRLRFYQAAVSKSSVKMAELSDQIELARMENDDVRMKALESARRDQLRLMHEEAQLEAAKYEQDRLRDELHDASASALAEVTTLRTERDAAQSRIAELEAELKGLRAKPPSHVVLQTTVVQPIIPLWCSQSYHCAANSSLKRA